MLETTQLPESSKKQELEAALADVLDVLTQEASASQLQEWFQRGGQVISLLDVVQEVGWSGERIDNAKLIQQAENIVLRLYSGGRAANKRTTGSGDFTLRDGKFLNNEGGTLENSPVFVDFVRNRKLDPEKIKNAIAEALSKKPFAELSPEQQAEVIDRLQKLSETSSQLTSMELRRREEKPAYMSIDALLTSVEENIKSLAAAQSELEKGRELLESLQFDPKERLQFRGVSWNYEGALGTLRQSIEDLAARFEGRYLVIADKVNTALYRLPEYVLERAEGNRDPQGSVAEIIRSTDNSYFRQFAPYIDIFQSKTPEKYAQLQKRVDEAIQAKAAVYSAESIPTLKKAIDRLTIYTTTFPGETRTSIFGVSQKLDQIQQEPNPARRDALIQELPQEWGLRSRVGSILRSQENLVSDYNQNSPPALNESDTSDQPEQPGRFRSFLSRFSGRN